VRTILISGAGIAGPTLAFWLKAAGFEPTLLERAPRLREGGYVIDFWGLGYDIAERMGLAAAVKRCGYHAKEMRVVGDDGRRLAGFGTRVLSELTGGRYVTLRRSDLSRLLIEKVKGRVEIIFGDEIAALRNEKDFAGVTLKNAGERRFDLVIGADGLHSAVRGLAFGPQAGFEKHLGYVVAAFDVGGYRPRDEDVYVMYGQPARMVGRFTLRDDRALFLFVFASAGQPLPTALDRQKALLRDIYRQGQWECPHILDELDRTDELYFDTVSQIRLQAWSQGRVALIGDAAFCVSLLAGQGSALAMIAAYVLAGELGAADGDHQRAFARYEEVLRDFIARKQRAAEGFAGVLAPRTPAGLWFRNLVINSMAVPGLARYAFGRDIVDRVRLPDYSWPSLDRLAAA
jgi:2-polyprenyl-6-methoxyphenol hydroxylase-like FAD-dependent oxidoreductase